MSEDDEQVSGEHIAWPMERMVRLVRAREHEGNLNPAQWEALRYIRRANRFSNSPGALTLFLGATKGTISQTLMALERKGLISKTPRPEEKRSIALSLTARGEEQLTQDPWRELADAADRLGNKTRRRLAKGLRELLEAELQRGRHKSFGQCSTCRYFREKSRDIEAGGPHYCMLFEAALSSDDASRICLEHEPR
ncbi:MAG: MarR family transcriptional regulator [Alphaproteobacteria bacterium]|nr:MarR family transcriptional regulator [Alphaproteobacteria bacterium]